jgi:thymidine kinase
MIEVIIGPMWSGKTDALIRRVTDFSGHKIMAYKPATDTRDDEIHSRAGLRYPCKKLGNLDLFRLIRYADQDCVIVIDEAQFFDDTILEVAKEFVHSKCILVLSGLAETSEREAFGHLNVIAKWAQRVTYLRARCQVCDMPAAHTYSRVHKDESVRVGSDGYEPRCDKHWSIVPGV